MLERLYKKRTPVDSLISLELAALLCQVSREIRRQIGILLDRRGRVEYVIVGTPTEIIIPDLQRVRVGAGRLRGVRLVHTHLNNEPLSRDDLNDLALLRLDVIAALGVDNAGKPISIYTAYINCEAKQDAPWTIGAPEQFSTFQFSFSEFIENLELMLRRSQGTHDDIRNPKVALIHISKLPRQEASSRLDELAELAQTEMMSVEKKFIFRGNQHAQSFIGPGRLKDIIISLMSSGVTTLIFDQELSPAQLKWISKFTDIQVIDRTQLILSIFARRAHSSDGKLKVELAGMRYILPRLGLKDDALSRIRGGIGMRGPGETAIELSRRQLLNKIVRIESALKRHGQSREERRKLRKRRGTKQVAVVGYTNAGKSSLLNAMTKSDLLVENKLFATLDPTSRRIRFPKNVEVVLTDTVGFIRDLPLDLLDAFRSTLEELHDADLLIHLVDISVPEYPKMLDIVEKTLVSLGLNTIPRILVFNKVDLVNEDQFLNECFRKNAIAFSALSGYGLGKLTDEVVLSINGDRRLG